MWPPSEMQINTRVCVVIFLFLYSYIIVRVLNVLCSILFDNMTYNYVTADWYVVCNCICIIG